MNRRPLRSSANRARAVQLMLSQKQRSHGSEPHRVSEPVKALQLRLRTSDRITHAAWPDWRSQDGNEAITVCGRRVHHCDLQHCRHGGRHVGREFSTRMSRGNDVDCITCLVTEAKR